MYYIVTFTLDAIPIEACIVTSTLDAIEACIVTFTLEAIEGCIILLLSLLIL